MYTITLPSGTKLENLKLNGNNFVSESEIDESLFTDLVDEVKIEGSEEDEQSYTMNNVYLLQQVHYGDGYYFILAEKVISDQEKINAQLMLQIAMLTEKLMEKESASE